MPNPLKRPRTDSNAHEDSNTGAVKDQEAWFSDGNIDIIAQGTAFRVHRGVLTIHSELFRDMLSIPQPTDAGDAGHIPVVEVTDSADNMRHLLLALYYNNKHFKPYTQAEFAVVSSLARIAHKYQVKNVLDEAMSRIKAVYPDNLDDFLEVLNERPPDLPMRSKDIDSLHVLQIARLVGDTSLLRPAFYRLCQLLRYSRRSLPAKPSEEASSTAYDEDIAQATAGMRALKDATLEVRQETFVPYRASGCYSDECLYAMEGMTSFWTEEPLLEECDAFMHGDVEEWDGVLCEMCMARVREREKDAQELVWDRLPQFFNFRDDY